MTTPTPQNPVVQINYRNAAGYTAKIETYPDWHIVPAVGDYITLLNGEPVQVTHRMIGLHAHGARQLVTLTCRAPVGTEGSRDDNGDAELFAWLESAHTMHWAVEALYVVEGYEASLTYFGETMVKTRPMSTLRDAYVELRRRSESYPAWTERTTK